MVINKSWFTQSADLSALTESNKVDLTVFSTSNTIAVELERRGSVATRATGTVIVNVEGGLVKGSRWFITGDLGVVIIKGDKLRLKKSVEVSINMKKLAEWSFPTEADPREKSNQSSWRDGRDVTTVLKDGSKVVDDPSSIKTHPMMTALGFSLRLTVTPTKGGAILLWLGFAPVGLDKLKAACDERG